jgi:hypothetical protein
VTVYSDRALVTREAPVKVAPGATVRSSHSSSDVVAGSPSDSPQPTGSVGIRTYSEVVDFIASKMREIARGRRAVQAAREKLVPEVEASKKQLDELPWAPPATSDFVGRAARGIRGRACGAIS